MRSAWLAIARTLVAAVAACSEDHPCVAANHCYRDADGTPHCETGYQWRDAAADDLVCVLGCGPCALPAPRCDGSDSVLSTASRCQAGACAFDETRFTCPNGCDTATGSCAGCNADCPRLDATRCVAGHLATCELDAKGCLHWGDATACASGLCDGDTTCSGCTDECTPGLTECRNGAVRGCRVAASGCWAWQTVEACASGLCADARACSTGLVTSGDLCTADGWCWVAPYPFGGHVRAVFGSGQTAWVATDGGALYRHEGSDWSAVFLGEQEEVNALWGSGPNDIWAVGRRGLMLHYDGAEWRYSTPLFYDDLLSVWGTASDNVYAAGGRLLHYDGIAWEHVEEIWGAGYIAGRAADDFCLAPRGGDTFRCWNGTDWSYEYAWGGAGQYGSKALFVTDDGTYQAIDTWGQLVQRGSDGDWREVADAHSEDGYVWVSHDGTRWRQTRSNTVERQVGTAWQAALETPCAGLVLSEGTDATWLGSGCGYFARDNAGSWQQLSGFDQRFKELYNFAAASDGTLYASGKRTVRFAGDTWTFFEHTDLLGVQAIAWIDGALYGVGTSSTFTTRLLRWSGSAWQMLWEGAMGFPIYGAKVWGTGADNIYVLAEPVQHWDGATVTPLNDRAAEALGIDGSSAGSMWAVGEATSISRFTNGAWSLFYAHGWAGDSLEHVVVFADDDVWFYGDIGSFLHWDGTHLDGKPSPGMLFGSALVAGAGGTLWAAAGYSGSNANLLHYDGHAWRLHRQALGSELRDVAETPAGAFILGNGRLQFRARPTAPACVPDTDQELCAALTCGAWLATDRCGHTRRVLCGVCSAPPPSLDCTSDGTSSLAASGDIALDGYGFLPLCGTEIVLMSTGKRLVHYDVEAATELHSVTLQESPQEIVVDPTSGDLFATDDDDTLYRVDLPSWQLSTISTLAGGAEHIAVGEPGELFVDVMRMWPGATGVGETVLQIISTSTGAVLHTIQERGFQGGVMHYDPQDRELFVYGWYDLHKLAYDPRHGQLYPLEYVSDFGSYCSAVHAPRSHKYIANCSQEFVVVDTEHMVESTNELLPPPYDARGRSPPTVAPSGDRLVVQHTNTLEWIDLSSFAVVDTRALPACTYPSTGRPFFSRDGSVAYAPYVCNSAKRLRWVKP